MADIRESRVDSSISCRKSVASSGAIASSSVAVYSGLSSSRSVRTPMPSGRTISASASAADSTPIFSRTSAASDSSSASSVSAASAASCASTGSRKHWNVDRVFEHLRDPDDRLRSELKDPRCELAVPGCRVRPP